MSTLDIAVVVPLEDPRGDVVDHLRSWTDRQTLERERYQLVAGTDGRHPEFERQVREILRPQDEMVSVPGGTLMALYDEAARAARGEVLVFTEAHCHAEPDCLGVVAERFGADPGLDGAMFHHRQGTFSEFSILSERWFDRCHAMWDGEAWIRLKIGGAAVRAEAYAAAGGLDPEMELFAPFFLSARLDEQGRSVEHLEEAVITHVLEDSMGEDLQHTRSHARGECVARRKHDPEFVERYFGPAGPWERRLAYRPELSRALLPALVAATRRNPRDAGWLGRELAAHLPASFAGARPRLAWENAVATMYGKVADSGLFPFETRWRSYISSTEHAVSAVEVEEGVRENGGSGRAGPVGSLRAEQLDGVIAGVYGLERWGDHVFRWTEPAALLRLGTEPDGGKLRIDTAGLRGAPLDYLHGVYASGMPLPRELISGDETGLEVRLPPKFARAAADSGLALISRPFVPADDGSSDRRRLGMPIAELELTAA